MVVVAVQVLLQLLLQQHLAAAAAVAAGAAVAAAASLAAAVAQLLQPACCSSWLGVGVHFDILARNHWLHQTLPVATVQFRPDCRHVLIERLADAEFGGLQLP